MADFSQKFTYHGDGHTFSVQTFTAPYDGLYKLEVYGAGGGNGKAIDIMVHAGAGGRGGYSVGYRYLSKGDVLYVGVGSMYISATIGLSEQKDVYLQFGGANGGGVSDGETSYYGGGGATHIALTDHGELKNYIDRKSEVLIVAGGGGAAGGSDYNGVGYGAGGSGGGLNGGDGEQANDAIGGTGGTQASAGLSDNGGDAPNAGNTASFGLGGTGTYANYGGTGGGGGWYGGGFGTRRTSEDEKTERSAGAGGGSGYIGGVPALTYKGVTYSPSTLSGGGAPAQTSGWAVITLVKRNMSSVYIGRESVSRICIGVKEISDFRIG
ncbi:MAG: glycine-rich protein [Bacteroidales bacterium]|nr:glycine-rich protein [Lachnoclostridium sp.]MCM1385266.1 glycine-rich protein [Lachnoclostridium sp.]MCM1466148.1 glycine-rich protein [Bacteroidales bacterium]